MTGVASSLLLALGQLAERRVLAILLKTLAVSLVLFAGVAWGGWYALQALFDWIGIGSGPFNYDTDLMRTIAALVVMLLGLWLAWRIVALAVINFFADEIVQAVEIRHYPVAAEQARDLPVSEQLSTSLRAALRALLVNLAALPFALILLYTGIGTALLFWAVNAALLGRELQDMVWLRHRQGKADPAPVRGFERFALGGVVAVLLTVPIVNLLAPILGAAAATHLIHRKGRT